MTTIENAGRVGRRLSRILLMLPYAIQHPGVTVGELARKFGVPKREVMEDLQLVFLCGLPGYGPGDLIDVWFDDDRVEVRMADYFAAPLRLTPSEALILYAGAEALVQLPGLEGADSLRGATEKLRRALGAGGVGVRVEHSPEAHLDALRDALEERRRVHLEYLSASRGSMTDRDVDPWGLVAALGRWYLVGFDHLSGEERMFRVDRIKSVSARDAVVEVPDDFDPERYRGAFVGDETQEHVTFEISPAAARWFEDYYPVATSAELDDGWRRVTLLSSGTRWAATLLLRLGADVRKVEPEAVMQEARTLAEEIARRAQEQAQQG
ncbi:MAG TPA: WYL domain-containing protein [Actinomycetota bacterium]|nr:WYL domain-containing protein [Actinomycetota bacterium]